MFHLLLFILISGNAALFSLCRVIKRYLNAPTKGFWITVKGNAPHKTSGNLLFSYATTELKVSAIMWSVLFEFTALCYFGILLVFGIAVKMVRYIKCPVKLLLTSCWNFISSAFRYYCILSLHIIFTFVY